MAFTSTDLDNIDTAIIAAATDGYASLSIGGRTAQRYALSELMTLREAVATIINRGTRQRIRLADTSRRTS